MSLNTDKLNVVDFTPTPRTNQVWNQGYDPDYAINGINKDFAEKLERELNEANVLLSYKNDTANTFMNQVKKLQKENAELREAVYELSIAINMAINTVECASLDKDYKTELPWYKCAKKALSKVKDS